MLFWTGNSFQVLWWVIPVRWFIWFASIFASIIGGFEVAEQYLFVTSPIAPIKKLPTAIICSIFGVLFLTKERILNVHKNMKQIDILYDDVYNLKSLLNDEQASKVNSVNENSKLITGYGIKLTPYYELKLGKMSALAGRFLDSKMYFEKSLTGFKSSEDRNGQSEALYEQGQILVSLGDLPGAINCYQSALKIAETDSILPIISKSLNGLGGIAKLRGDKIESKRLWKLSLEIAESTDNISIQAAPIYNLANAASNLLEKEELHNKSLEIERLTKNSQGEVISLIALANVKQQQGLLNESERYLLESQNLAREIGDRIGEVEAMLALGKLFQDENPKRTKLMYGKAEKIILDTDHKYGKAKVLERLAEYKEQIGEKNQAMLLFRESLSIVREIGLIGREAGILSDIADLLSDLGDFDKAIEMHFESYRIYNEIGHAKLSIMSLSSVALCARWKGDNGYAKDKYLQCIQIAETHEFENLRAHIMENLAILEGDEGNFKAGEKLLNDAQEIYSKLGKKNNQADILKWKSNFAMKTGELDNAIEYMENGLKLKREIGSKRSIAQYLRSIAKYLRAEELSKSKQYYHEALDIFIELRDKKGQAGVYSGLGDLSYRDSKFSDADEFHKLSNSIYTEIGEVAIRISNLYGWGAVASATGDIEKQEKILLEALELAKEVSYEKEEKRISRWLEELSQEKSEQKVPKVNYKSRPIDLDIRNERFEEE